MSCSQETNNMTAYQRRDWLEEVYCAEEQELEELGLSLDRTYMNVQEVLLRNYPEDKDPYTELKTQKGMLADQYVVEIRFALCNLDCPYCDVIKRREASREINARQLYKLIHDEIEKKATRTPTAIVFTGGEPCLQYLQPFLWLLASKQAKEKQEKISLLPRVLETNGYGRWDKEYGMSDPQRAAFNWITLYPHQTEQGKRTLVWNNDNMKYVDEVIAIWPKAMYGETWDAETLALFFNYMQGQGRVAERNMAKKGYIPMYVANQNPPLEEIHKIGTSLQWQQERQQKFERAGIVVDAANKHVDNTNLKIQVI